MGGGRGGGGGGWEVEGGLHSNTNGSAVPSVGDPDWHN